MVRMPRIPIAVFDVTLYRLVLRSPDYGAFCHHVRLPDAVPSYPVIAGLGPNLGPVLRLFVRSNGMITRCPAPPLPAALDCRGNKTLALSCAIGGSSILDRRLTLSGAVSASRRLMWFPCS
jgi:hypothetical protein